jgi:hypothetical protein
MSKKAKLGKLTTVENKEKTSHLAAEKYIAVWVEDENCIKKCLLLTESDIAKASVRTLKNSEDVPALKKSFWEVLLG